MICSDNTNNRSKEMGNLVAYYRVSTRKQGESGLGLSGSPRFLFTF
jgi:hypothetical protein